MMKCAHEGAPQRGRAVCRYNGRSDQTCARPYGLAGVQSVEWRGYGREGSHNAPHGQVHGPAPLIRRHPHLRPLELAREGPQEHLRARRRRESPTVAPPREGTPSTFRRGVRSRPNTCVCVCVCVCVRYWRSTPCVRQRTCPARCASPPRIAPPTRAAAERTPAWVQRARAPTTRPPPAPPPSCARSPTPAALHLSAPDVLSVDAPLWLTEANRRHQGVSPRGCPAAARSSTQSPAPPPRATSCGWGTGRAAGRTTSPI